MSFKNHLEKILNINLIVVRSDNGYNIGTSLGRKNPRAEVNLPGIESGRIGKSGKPYGCQVLPKLDNRVRPPC